MHPVTITIPTKVMDHQVTITTATQDTDTTNLTNRRNWLMYLSRYMDRSAKSNYIRSRMYYNIHHSTTRIKPEDHPVKGEYANAFNKFHPKKVEVNEATMEEAIKYGHFLKRSEEDIAEAIDIYKTLGNETFYGPEEEDPADQQEQPKQ